MGWWSEKHEGKTVHIGDEPLLVLGDMVEHFSKHYLEERGSKPSLEEFLLCLQRVIGPAPDDFFRAMDAMEIVRLCARLKKVAKRQRYQEGDYFAIPLKPQYWYGRILLCEGGDLIEVYDLQTARLLSFEELLRSKGKVVFFKHVWGADAFLRGRWKIVGHEPIPKSFRFPEFYLGFPPNFQVACGRKTRWTSRKEAAKLEPIILFSPQEIEERLTSGDFSNWPYIAEARNRDFGSNRYGKQIKA